MNTAILLLVSTMPGFPAPKPAVVEDDLQKMQGTWRLFASSMDGIYGEFKNARIEPARTFISGDRLKEADNEYRIEILGPGIMDLVCVKGNLKGQRLFAIYSLQANQLKICRVICEDPDDPIPRPQEFKTTAESDHRLVILERILDKKEVTKEPQKQKRSGRP